MQPQPTNEQTSQFNVSAYFLEISPIWTSYFQKKISITKRDQILGRYRRQLSASDNPQFSQLSDLA